MCFAVAGFARQAARPDRRSFIFEFVGSRLTSRLADSQYFSLRSSVLATGGASRQSDLENTAIQNTKCVFRVESVAIGKLSATAESHKDGITHNIY